MISFTDLTYGKLIDSKFIEFLRTITAASTTNLLSTESPFDVVHWTEAKRVLTKDDVFTINLRKTRN